MATFLQLWGGVFYLLNKVFFSCAERAEKSEAKRWWRIYSWVVYIIGFPAWAFIFIRERNWIAASLELGGLPAMILGLMIALGAGVGGLSRGLNCIAFVCVVLGIGYSTYDLGGLITLSQLLELGITVGYLIGTYLLAKNRPNGYLWFMVMNISCGWLMWTEGYLWLAIQQAISLGFIIDAFIVERRRRTIY